MQNSNNRETLFSSFFGEFFSRRALKYFAHLIKENVSPTILALSFAVGAAIRQNLHDEESLSTSTLIGGIGLSCAYVNFLQIACNLGYYKNKGLSYREFVEREEIRDLKSVFLQLEAQLVSQHRELSEQLIEGLVDENIRTLLERSQFKTERSLAEGLTKLSRDPELSQLQRQLITKMIEKLPLTLEARLEQLLQAAAQLQQGIHQQVNNIIQQAGIPQPQAEPTQRTAWAG